MANLEEDERRRDVITRARGGRDVNSRGATLEILSRRY